MHPEWPRPDRNQSDVFLPRSVTTNVPVLYWNVEGLSSKLNEPTFVSYVSTFDVCCFAETFTSNDFDFNIYFSDFLVFHAPAVKLSHQGRRSGGLVTLVRKSLSNCVSQLACTIDNMTLLKFNISPLGEFILISVYIPPKDFHYYCNNQRKKKEKEDR